MSHKKKARKALAKNMMTARDNDFRLTYSLRSTELATCKAKNQVILGGLGGMGCGVMAFTLSERKTHKDTPDFPTIQEAYDYAWEVTTGIVKF